MLEHLKTGIVYRNPVPHLHSVHAYFPSVAAMPDGQVVATYVRGEAFESPTLQLHLSRSEDGGESWQEQGPLFPRASARLTHDMARIMATPQGQLVANLVRMDRTDHPEEGLCNPANIGFVPTELLVAKSADGGRTWSAPMSIPRLLHQCEFEICAPIAITGTGRWLWPTSLWRDWQGNFPHGHRMIAMLSDDQGHSWPRYVTVMTSPDNQCTFWESKIVPLSDGRLLAVAWRFNEATQKNEPNGYAISNDQGESWSKPQSTGLWGETVAALALENSRVLCVYRRMDKKGLWVTLAHLEGDRWVNDADQPLWGYNAAAALTGSGQTMVETFQALRFGAPSLTRLSDGSVFVAFWCYEDCISIIRWFKFRIA